MKTTNRILIVDDNVEFCTNITDILELKGYEVMAVHDGFKALEAVKDNSFSVVLMDIMMPMMDGVETHKKLREIAPEVRVIMVTAYAVEDLVKEALRGGAFGAFYKPIDFEKLISCIELALPDGTLIMVVDDDEQICANLSDVLSEKGYRVRVAGDGRNAMRVATENRFDVVLLDMKLPIMNGLETYLAIRDIQPSVVTILITGYIAETTDSVQQALKKGAYVCLEKPLDMDYLLELLEKVREARSAGIVR